jgi:hypothetical protein
MKQQENEIIPYLMKEIRNTLQWDKDFMLST